MPMTIGEPVSRRLLEGRRHGVLVQDAERRIWLDTARTRRGARRLYLDALDWVPVHPGRAGASPGDQLTVVRVERERVVDQQHIRVPDDPAPSAGVREPRRPRPSAGGAAAVVEP
jgi:hypothetical protein